jgi:hypothetical protein
MMVVKVEVWPHGEVDSAYEIARVGIINRGDGGPAIADYNVIGLVDRDTEDRVTETLVLDHIRRAGWRRLVIDALAQPDSRFHNREYVDRVVELLRKG